MTRHEFFCHGRLELIKSDITKLIVDAIVNATDEEYSGLGGVDLAIHTGAGPQIKHDCQQLTPCQVTEAKITKGHNLLAGYVIHTVGPRYFELANQNVANELRQTYINCLELAAQNNLQSIAFPCISTGVFGYPLEKACDIAVSTVKSWLAGHKTSLSKVVFCVYDSQSFDLYLTKLKLKESSV